MTKQELWQFLFKLLAHRTHQDSIDWLGDDGSFEIIKPDVIACLWGQTKSNSDMTYDKMTRSIRNYYKTGLMSKVKNKKHGYKFEWDLYTLTGYTVAKLKSIPMKQRLV